MSAQPATNHPPAPADACTCAQINGFRLPMTGALGLMALVAGKTAANDAPGRLCPACTRLAQYGNEVHQRQRKATE